LASKLCGQDDDNEKRFWIATASPRKDDGCDDDNTGTTDDDETGLLRALAKTVKTNDASGLPRLAPRKDDDVVKTTDEKRNWIASCARKDDG